MFRFDRIVVDLRDSEKAVRDLRVNCNVVESKLHESLEIFKKSIEEWITVKTSIDLFRVSADTMCVKFRDMETTVESDFSRLNHQYCTLHGDIKDRLNFVDSRFLAALSELKQEIRQTPDPYVMKLLATCRTMMIEVRNSQSVINRKRSCVHEWHVQSMRQSRNRMGLICVRNLLAKFLTRAIADWRICTRLDTIEKRVTTRCTQLIPDVKAEIDVYMGERLLALENRPTCVCLNREKIRDVCEELSSKRVKHIQIQIAELFSIVNKDESNTCKQVQDILKDVMLLWSHLKQLDSTKMDCSNVERIVNEQIQRRVDSHVCSVMIYIRATIDVG